MPPQPDQVDLPDRVDTDPLLAFDAELATSECQEQPVESSVEPAPNAPTEAASPPPDEVSHLAQRIDHAEQSLDRALAEVGSLKSELATLVTSIDDIEKRQSRARQLEAEQSLDRALTEIASLKSEAKQSLARALAEIASLKSGLATVVTAIDDVKKRQSRRPEVAVVAPPIVARSPSPRTIAAVAILFVVLGATFWSLSSLITDDGDEPPAVEVGSGELGAGSGGLGMESRLGPGTSQSTPQSPLTTPTPILAAAKVDSSSPPPERSAPARSTASAVRYVGTLSIDASPGGEVFINRKPVGRTPLRLERLRAGSPLVWIERDGYRRWTRVVTVAANRISRVAAALDPLDP